MLSQFFLYFVTTCNCPLNRTKPDYHMQCKANDNEGEKAPHNDAYQQHGRTDLQRMEVPFLQE